MNLLTKADDSETQEDPVSFTPIFFFLLLLLFFEKSKWGKHSLEGGYISPQPKLDHRGVCIWAIHTSVIIFKGEK